MGNWTGQMPTAHLNDRKIRPIEHSSWADARRYFKNRRRHWETVEKYMDEIRHGGLREPILIAQSQRYPTDFYIGDGHHRAVALRETGAREFPFHWYVIPGFGKPRMEREPFPYHLLT